VFELLLQGLLKSAGDCEFERLASKFSLQLRDSNELLAETLRRKMPDARMCGSCGYGPIDRVACSDLQAHDGQVVGHRADGTEIKINNGCPKCDWRANRWAKWPLWDGKLSRDFLEDNPATLERGREQYVGPHQVRAAPGMCTVCPSCRHCSTYGAGEGRRPRAPAPARLAGTPCDCKSRWARNCAGCGWCSSCCDSSAMLCRSGVLTSDDEVTIDDDDDQEGASDDEDGMAFWLAAPTPRQTRGPCVLFQRRGYCRYGDACRFLHVGIAAEPEGPWERVVVQRERPVVRGEFAAAPSLASEAVSWRGGRRGGP